ncbi:multiheme c-type cytochrome [Halopseudomonas sp.]|uniref:multiheme c-type cytochrome n=1 Tax=Halopseudomonas sp. TaxID=2901191 RepID=UPI0030028FAE
MRSKQPKRTSDPQPSHQTTTRKHRNILYLALALTLLVIAAAGWWWTRPAPAPNVRQADTASHDSTAKPANPSVPQQAQGTAPPTEKSAAADYVGMQACVGCHAEQAERFTGSHHDLAMQESTDASVLGDFNDRTFTFGGVTSRFFRRGDAFMVNTADAQGEYHDYLARYTFGVYPLQQYLLALPGGRYQAFSVAWDARPEEEGGQRWFQLNPEFNGDEPDKAFHWTGRNFNWNLTCAECHSTNLQRNYDPVSNSYDTQWDDINVACESCHGPGSLHLQWSADPQQLSPEQLSRKGLTLNFDERREAIWQHNPQTGQPERSIAKNSETEIQACAACHSRRAQLFDDNAPAQQLVESFLLSNLDQGLYHADGQIQDEVFVHGSFVQSKMYDAGVTCSDCHDPHSLELKASGNGVCLQCHIAAEYETPKHHFHESLAGSQCVDCHMPATTYMGVDPRRDHSLRIPRPDQTVSLGVPNACNGCHEDQSAQWAADHLVQWYGDVPQGHQQFAKTLHDARSGSQQSPDALLALLADEGQPVIARATAASLLQYWPQPEVLGDVVMALRNSDPQLRLGALDALESLQPITRWQMASPLLTDPIRTVRVEAAGQLLDIPPDQVPEGKRTAFINALQEYVDAQQANADNPSAQLNLAVYYQSRNQLALAEEAYQRALLLDPYFEPAYVNLADLYRASLRDPDGERLLRSAIARVPQAASLHFSLGLLQIRQKQLEQALVALAHAVELEPGNQRYRYVYAVALNSAGQRKQALDVLNKGLELTPDNQQLSGFKAQLEASPE